MKTKVFKRHDQQNGDATEKGVKRVERDFQRQLSWMGQRHIQVKIFRRQDGGMLAAMLKMEAALRTAGEKDRAHDIVETEFLSLVILHDIKASFV